MREIRIKFGKYKGVELSKVPINYLKWCINNDILRGRAMFYAKSKTNHPKDIYEVTVTNSLDSDGQYLIESYDKNSAISQARRQHNIQITQSFCGTTFRAIKLN